MNPLIQLKATTPPLLITLTLLCFALLPRAQAVVPPPDGGYPNFTTAEGQNALQNLTTGAGNTAVGWFSLFADTTGSFNTATGAGTLLFNTADANTAFGTATLLFNTTGFQNTAVGTTALLNNTTGNNNTATGNNALESNTEGVFNTAVGAQALSGNETGSRNTANGFVALNSNSTGNDNTAIGGNALISNETGSNNTAVGAGALSQNETGFGHTAVGYRALYVSNASGQFCFANTAVGSLALGENTDGCSNTAIGGLALGNNTSGEGNVAVGLLAGSNVTTANNVICIGTAGANVSDSCYIGNIFGEPGGAQAVFANSDGKLGAQVSSLRFKDEIEPLEEASEVIYGLKPVSFRYKPEIEPTRPRGFGLIAEDVEKTNPDLIVRDKEGKPYSVRYEQINAMLLNEFLKEHRRNEEQGATIARQQKQIDALVATVKGQAAQMQKVSAQLEASKPAPRVVNNP